MKVDHFDLPGNLTDFDGPLAKVWSDSVSGRLDGETAGVLQQNPGIQPQFYNPAKLDVSGTPAPISWPAFPAIVELTFGAIGSGCSRRRNAATTRTNISNGPRVKKNGKITRVMFTCESPEYWEFISPTTNPTARRALHENRGPTGPAI